VTTFYLIRHGANDWLPHSIAGWLPGVHLNREGRRQAERLAVDLARIPIQAVYSSPLERAQETAAPIAQKLGLAVRTAEAIGEVRFGDWTGKSIAALEEDPRWRQWNRFRSGTRIPNGETMLEVQARMAAFIQSVCAEAVQSTVAVVSHGDPVRAVLLQYLGMPLDFVHRIEISPASVSVLRVDPDGAQVCCCNCSANAAPTPE
jgi:probable phosphomutase (TIGR03848 family)